MSELPATPKVRRRHQSGRDSLTPAKTDQSVSKLNSSSINISNTTSRYESPRKSLITPTVLTASPKPKRQRYELNFDTMDFCDASSVLNELSNGYATPTKVRTFSIEYIF